MIYTCHRINTIKDLKEIPSNFGIEIDLSIYKNKIVIKHDPFGKGEAFEKFIHYFNHRFIILNVKCEGLEKKIISILKKKNIKNFFFLDSSFPFIFKLSKFLTKKFAIRISDYESINTAFLMKNKIKWLWVDCFQQYKLTIPQIKKLKYYKFKICLVSPELHKRKISRNDKKFFLNLKKNKVNIDMICIKKNSFNKIKYFF
tara:strand:- start:446 stop:1048 length:603 start_codon:yes stop_codon:yes gene_type:complete